jgi:hypothetical protein
MFLLPSKYGIKFNRECAGKQSRAACKAAQKLNREKGLPESSC